ncbi:MAG: DUF6809 family protein [Clostridiaceae bacterium]
MKEDLDEMLRERLDHNSAATYHDPEIETLKKVRKELDKKLKQNLEEEDKEIYQELSETVDSIAATSEEIMFYKGFYDGIRFYKEIQDRIQN